MICAPADDASAQGCASQRHLRQQQQTTTTTTTATATATTTTATATATTTTATATATTNHDDNFPRSVDSCIGGCVS